MNSGKFHNNMANSQTMNTTRSVTEARSQLQLTSQELVSVRSFTVCNSRAICSQASSVL